MGVHSLEFLMRSAARLFWIWLGKEGINILQPSSNNSIEAEGQHVMYLFFLQEFGEVYVTS